MDRFKLIKLLMIQQKIHKGLFAVMDGTFAGDGPGPRCMIPHVKNVILASSDQVAIDGTTQSGYSANTLLVGAGNNAAIKIQLDGANLNNGEVGLYLNSA